VTRTLLIVSAAAAACVPAVAAAGVRQDSTVLMSENPRGREFQEKWGFSDAIVVGDTIYLSGIVAGTRPARTVRKPPMSASTSRSAEY
jgi:hypothetical protein